MKKIAFALFALAGSLITGCSSDDSNNPSGIQGRWHLVKVESGWTASGYSFDKGTVTWTFGDNGEVKIVNGAVLPAEAGATGGPATGTYDYTVGPWDDICDEALTIDDDNYGCMVFANDTLKVSTAPVDGPIYSLVR